MMLRRLLCFICLFAFSACQNADSNAFNPSHYCEIAARDEGNKLSRPVIYRIKVPQDWQFVPPSDEESLVDTKKPLCSFLLNEKKGQIQITIHNFPSESLNDRIPCEAQVARWKRQFSSIDPLSLVITPQAFSGYCGLLFEAAGNLEGEKKAVMAWTLQLGTELYTSLQSKESCNLKQRCADVTIKVIGSYDLLQDKREAIIDFARSFEQIDEIPQPS